MLRALAVLLLGLVPLCRAQMSSDQKTSDFQQLAALFAKRYAFLEWKLAAVKFDGLDLRPWLDRIARSKTDLEYFEICAEYVAKFQDAHTGFELPSNFIATLGFSTDLYDGKVLIDQIDRKRLSAGDFPFQIGDELVSIDGRSAGGLLDEFVRFNGHGSPRSARRLTAALLTSRPQAYLPRAHELADDAVVVIAGRDGVTGTYTIPWKKSGTPYIATGPVPAPRTARKTHATAASDVVRDEPGLLWPKWLQRVRAQQVMRARTDRASTGMGEVTPIFALPADFSQRVGTEEYDGIFSGTVKFQGLTLGFLRVGSFSYLDTTELQREIRYMEQNTDGMIVDMTRNPGGYGCSAEALARFFAPSGIRSVGNSVRVTWDYIQGLRYDIELAKEYEEDEEVIVELQRQLDAGLTAFARNRGMTEPLPICGTSMDLLPAVDRAGKQVTYSKPVMVLIDDRTTSAAEMFTAIMQDSKRALIYGYRSAGAGGSVGYFPAGTYSETGVALAVSIMIRKDNVTTADYPAMPYVENIGIRPDKVDDYMTADNLVSKGAGFVSGFLSTMADYIAAKPGN